MPQNMPKKADTPITIWKCATTKYVSCKWISNVELPKKIPVRPPEMNKLTKPMANNMPGVNLRLPRHMVVIQLNTLMAEGTAISSVNNTNTEPKNGLRPVTNIWCAHTRNARMAMANNEPTMAI